jgi:iron complex transport system permease protein
VESSRLIFIGLLVGGILSSVTTIGLLFLQSQELQGVFGWLVGSLSLVTWTDLLLTAVYAVPGLLLLVPATGRANTLQLGADVAISLGQRRELDRLVVVLAAVVLTAGVVVVAGGVAFVGLMAPHMVRATVGSDLRRLVPASMLAGAAMVLVADFVARLFDPRWLPWEAVSGVHLPVGVFLSLFGAVFLLRLLRTRAT